MCTAIPLKIINVLSRSEAVCNSDGTDITVDISFVDEVEPGDWVSVHLGVARSKMTHAEAQVILDALSALQMVRDGQTDVDHLFADLIGREPQRPPKV